jgi:hypothetical protein
MQVRTYRDGTRWLRWLAPPSPEQPTARMLRSSAAGTNCALCDADAPAWTEAPRDATLPKVDLVFECARCGRTTLQGRLPHRMP